MFSYLRTGNRVQVSGTIRVFGFNIFDDPLHLGGLPFRTVDFASTNEVIGQATPSLEDFGLPGPSICNVSALVGQPWVDLELLEGSGDPFYDQGTISVDFSYDVDP